MGDVDDALRRRDVGWMTVVGLGHQLRSFLVDLVWPGLPFDDPAILVGVDPAGEMLHCETVEAIVAVEGVSESLFEANLCGLHPMFLRRS